MAPFLPSFFRQLVLKYRPYPSQARLPPHYSILQHKVSYSERRPRSSFPLGRRRRRRGRARLLPPTRNFLFVVDGEKEFAKEDFPPLLPTMKEC